MQRLLAAAITTINSKGLAGVTIPEIAAAAGLSVGAVYRRFLDKDALIRAAFLHLLVEAQASNEATLPVDRFRGMTLPSALNALGRALVVQYHGRTTLLKALDQFLEIQTDEVFKARALHMVEANMRRLVQALLLFRDDIAAADPERAITIALLSATTVIEAHKLHLPLLWERMAPLDDEALAAEATRIMVSYLTRPPNSVVASGTEPQ